VNASNYRSTSLVDGKSWLLNPSGDTATLWSLLAFSFSAHKLVTSGKRFNAASGGGRASGLAGGDAVCPDDRLPGSVFTVAGRPVAAVAAGVTPTKI